MRTATSSVNGDFYRGRDKLLNGNNCLYEYRVLVEGPLCLSFLGPLAFDYLTAVLPATTYPLTYPHKQLPCSSHFPGTTLLCTNSCASHTLVSMRRSSGLRLERNYVPRSSLNFDLHDLLYTKHHLSLRFRSRCLSDRTRSLTDWTLWTHACNPSRTSALWSSNVNEHVGMPPPYSSLHAARHAAMSSHVGTGFCRHSLWRGLV